MADWGELFDLQPKKRPNSFPWKRPSNLLKRKGDWSEIALGRKSGGRNSLHRYRLLRGIWNWDVMKRPSLNYPPQHPSTFIPFQKVSSILSREFIGENKKFLDNQSWKLDASTIFNSTYFYFLVINTNQINIAYLFSHKYFLYQNEWN